MTYKKLVRDKIPEIIKANGEEPLVEFLDDDQFYDQLCKKLKEEVDEFLQDDTLEELAYVIEVLMKILEKKGSSMVELEDIRKRKLDKRGGFEEGIFLKDVVKNEVQ